MKHCSVAERSWPKNTSKVIYMFSTDRSKKSYSHHYYSFSDKAKNQHSHCETMSHLNCYMFFLWFSVTSCSRYLSVDMFLLYLPPASLFSACKTLLSCHTFCLFDLLLCLHFFLTNGLHVIAWLSLAVTPLPPTLPLSPAHSLFISLRRVPSGEDRGFVQWEVPCDQEVGVGPFLHRMAVLGHTVSHTRTCAHTHWVQLVEHMLSNSISLCFHAYTVKLPHEHVMTQKESSRCSQSSTLLS